MRTGGGGQACPWPAGLLSFPHAGDSAVERQKGVAHVARFSPEEIEQFWRQQNPRRRSLREELEARRLPYAVAVENLSKDWNIGNFGSQRHESNLRHYYRSS